MNQEVSTVDKTISSDVPWGESFARTDINLHKVRSTFKKPEFTWTALPELGFDENVIMRYLDDKTADLHGSFFFPWNFIFPKPGIFSETIEHSTYGDKKIQVYKVELDNSTTRQNQIVDLNNEVENLIELANDLEFEDGMVSGFSKKLISFIERHGGNSIEALAPIFISEEVNAEIISEALRWIGRIEHQDTKNMRLWLLERCLFCSSPLIRDGATLGLASMNESSAKSFLIKAIQKESIKELREDMKEVLLELENLEDAAAFKKDSKK